MIPKRISLKNFLSFGDPAVELTFSDGEPLWVLAGPNGIGKSAVFDAITYSLYGEHRGGKHKAEQLIRHGANAFEVEYDFEFNANDYRIRRSRPRKGRSTQQLLQWRGGEWKPIDAGGQAGSVDAADIKRWVEETLGLNFEAFTNSVLLQQGKADKLFNASRDERIAVLKGIIGFEQFEAVSERVHDATLAHERKAEAIATQLANLTPVADDQLAAAIQAAGDAEAARTRAQDSLTAAVEGIARAREWQKLEIERKELQGRLAEAELRRNDEIQIREGKAVMDDLSGAIPVLEILFKVRGRIAGLSVEATKARAQRDEKIDQRDSKRKAADEARQAVDVHKRGADELGRSISSLNEAIRRNSRFLIEVKTLEDLEEKLKEFPPSLDTAIVEANAMEAQADCATRGANTARTQAETLLTQAKEQQECFKGQEVGRNCSVCGQPITQEHAARENARLANEIGNLNTALKNSHARAQAAAEVQEAARKRRRDLENTRVDRDNRQIERDTKRTSLQALGCVRTSADLAAQLASDQAAVATFTAQKSEHDALHSAAQSLVAGLQREQKTIDGAVAGADTMLRECEMQLASAAGEENTNAARLSEKWRKMLPTLTEPALVELHAQRDQLIAGKVLDKFKALEQDEAKRADWTNRLAEVQAGIDEIPIGSRVAAPDAEKRQAQANESLKKANLARDDAVAIRDDATQRRKMYNEFTVAHREADEQHRLHKKLDGLLGQTGLQRELVRDAEEQIVAFANETLQHLSDSDMALEEDASGDSGKAFDLSVRCGGGEPIGVNFLSGSQRFRVAVSVALAVGRFASGRARPLEGVIIDEGFGSLDRDGLRAMAEELQRLQRQGALRRVLLVSHQPEFTDYFAVGYALTAGEQGTISTPFRR